MKKPCGCCGGTALTVPQAEYNRPGLTALAYRAGTYATFFESALARLSNMYIDVDGDRIYPLRTLTTRETGDPSIALLDAWAIVADVLTFYQERIANEGYLLTATERMSVVELTRLIGYRPRPGVAASVFLAFTVANGFRGEIPAGTRAQSIPGTGETAQPFETYEKLIARDTWNALKPRLTRPQVISPPPAAELGMRNHLGTNADVLDSIYFKGVATNLKAGDALLLVAGEAANEQFLRRAERVIAQADLNRTQVALRQQRSERTGDLKQLVRDILQRFINDAGDQFPGSSLASQTAALLAGLEKQLDTGVPQAVFYTRAMVPRLEALHELAVKRQFTRVEVWLQHLLNFMAPLAALIARASSETGEGVLPAPSFAVSSLERLGTLLPAISRARSVQPANAARLGRSVAKSFAPNADTAPRLIAALNPVAAPLVYNAWGSVQPTRVQQEVLAARAKAALFASNFAGASSFNRTSRATVFTPATIQNSWRDILPEEPQAVAVLALDAVYDKITADSWVAVIRPVFRDREIVERRTTYHKVTEVETLTLDTRAGFSAKVSVLRLKTPWLAGDEDIQFLDQPMLLRGTVVYGQTEPLELAEMPLDRDVEGASVELDGLYDGLEAGKWVIVSGERTDIPDVSGVQGSELAMVSAVSQGAGKEQCQPFLPKFVPFVRLLYISDGNEAGDRLVVGVPAAGLRLILNALALPSAANQQFCEGIQLSPGLYADSYVPTEAEKKGEFSAFASVLIDPLAPGQTFPGGIIPASRQDTIFAWRIRRVVSGSETVHTTVQFASALAYKYDAFKVALHANVVKATHGQTTGEILGDGDASQPFQTFALRQKPLTYLSAATPEGAESTLSVRVNDIEWHETANLAGLEQSDREFVTRTDDSDKTSVTFGNGERGARVPTGAANVKATYRYGIGGAGNVKAGQISQLATQPLGLQGVINPLPATGGADRDTLDQARRNAPLAVMALDRLVSIQDYADFARTYAGIAKAVARGISDGRRQLVHLTIAGNGDIPIDTDSDLYQNFLLSLRSFGDASQPVQVCVRKIKLLVMDARVKLLPDYAWEFVLPRIRDAVLATFSFDARDFGQTAFLSEAVAAVQAVEGVSYVDFRVFDSVAEDVTPQQLLTLASTLKLNQYVMPALAELDPAAKPAGPPCTRIRPAELVYMTPEIPDTLILSEIGA